MAQLEQWKANHQQGKINQFVNEMNHKATSNNETKNGSVKNTQGEAHREAKNKYQGKLWANPLAFQFTQLTRQFKLILDSNQRCLEVYPDDFHHKLKMRDEMMDLIDRLKSGGKLFNALAKSQGITFCRDNQATLKDFNQANGYLIHKFGEVVAQIERLNIERIEGEKLQGASNE